MILNTQPRTKAAYSLMHEGAKALADMEADGFCIDKDYLLHQRKKLIASRERKTEQFETTKLGREWKKAYGEKMTCSNNHQVSAVLFKCMGLKAKGATAKGHASVSEDSLRQMDVGGIPLLLEIRAINTTLGTFIKGLLAEEIDGVVHPFFHLHLTRTYRGSGSDPNPQNMPIRDPLMGGMVRRGIVPRDGNQIMEMDMKGAEVRVAACYHQDPTMIAYILDPKKDMHRDMAMDCFGLKADEVTKQARYTAKGGFVFAEFYGSYWKDVGPSLWQSAGSLTTAAGLPMREHLAKQGWKNETQFTAHIKEVEHGFWYNRFPEYRKWKEAWWKQYCRRGYFDTLTGFRCGGVMSRNDSINYPVQGSSFHCLLWTLIQMNHFRKRNKMGLKIILQIHDSLVHDSPPAELVPYIAEAKRVLAEDIREEWKWLCVPLGADVKIAPVNQSWFDQKEQQEE